MKHVRSEGRIVKRAVYIALEIDMDGKKDVIGMYVGENEAAALEELESFGEKWNSKYPKIYKSWSERWAGLSFQAMTAS